MIETGEMARSCPNFTTGCALPKVSICIMYLPFNRRVVSTLGCLAGLLHRATFVRQTSAIAQLKIRARQVQLIFSLFSASTACLFPQMLSIKGSFACVIVVFWSGHWLLSTRCDAAGAASGFERGE